MASPSRIAETVRGRIGLAVALIAAALGLVACGGGSSSTEAEATRPAALEPANETTPEAKAAHAEAAPRPEPEPVPEREGPTAAQVKEAVAIVRGELPDIPIWKGTTFHAVKEAGGDVCVERIQSKHAAALFGEGPNAGFVVVSVPEMTAGEPKDGTCGHPAQEPDERLSPAELEDMARELAVAIEEGSSEIVSIAERVKRKIDKPLPVLTKQANLIHSATVAAIEGAESGGGFNRQLEAALRYLEEAVQGP
jgi:hypothetical protein